MTGAPHRVQTAAAESASPRTSSDDAHSHGSDSPPCQAEDTCCQRKRKHTYYARKDELQVLWKEFQALSHQLEQLQGGRQCPLAKILSVNASLRSMIKRNQRTIATAQSLMDSHGFVDGKALAGSYIHLPRDAAERERMLCDMKPWKLREALEYLLHRSQHLDLRLSTRQVETSTTPPGDHVSNHWEICAFDGDAATVEHVFNAMARFVRDEEMEEAEQTQQINGSCDDIAASQIRTTSTSGYGNLRAEKNNVVHAEFFDQCDLLNEPHGVLSVDFVDHDDLYPYQHNTHIRKDIAMAVLVFESPRRRGNDAQTVSLIRWSQTKIHASPLAPARALDELSREGLSCNFDAMMRSIREQITRQPHSVAQ